MNKIFSKVFMWLFIGLALTFGVAYTVSTNENMVYNLFSDSKYFIVIIAEFVVAMILSVRIRKMSSMTASILYLLYSGLTGLTLSSIFVVYTITSIVWVFAIAAGLFLIFGLIGYFTKLDITKIGTFLMMGLLGILLVYLVNVFIGSNSVDMALAVISIIVFLGFIAYDIQIVKRNMYAIDDENNMAIYGAFQLYLDFINIFLDLIRLFGNSKD